MNGHLYRLYHDHGIDTLVCHLFGHRWQDAGWRAKTCARCLHFEMWWES